MWFVYAPYNKTANKIYIGQTNSLERRLKEHNEKKRGRHYRANFKGEWELVYKEEYKNKRLALVREKQLKSYQGREFVKKLIN